METLPDLNDFGTILKWLAGGGAAVAVSYVFAMLAEYWPRWDTFPVPVKFTVPLLVAIGMSLLAAWVLSKPELVEQAAPIFGLVAITCTAYIATQKAHQSAKGKIGKG
jgi:hypothetical protein